MLRDARRRLPELWRWMAQPWRSVGLAIALIASFAAPALMASSADLFRESAADTISQQLLDESRGGLGMTITVSGGVITADAIAGLDTSLGRRIDEIPLLGEPTRTISVSDVGLSSPVNEAEPAAITSGSNGWFFQRAGAIEALAVLAGDTATGGIWISERVADQYGFRPGAAAIVNGSEPVMIAGIYANLWEGDRDAYWDDLPPAMVPTYIAALAGPARELYIAPESVMTRLGVVGEIRWDATLEVLPESHQSLVGLSFLYRDIERSYTDSTSVARALEVFGGAGARVPTLRTNLFAVSEEADLLIAELEQPIQTTAAAGIVIGLLITSAGAAFAVRKRHAEFRLLRSDGDSGWRFAIRAVGQNAPFAVVGAAIGVACALALVSTFGPPASINTEAIDASQVVATVAVGLALTALVTAMAAIRILDEPSARAPNIRFVWLLPIIGLAVAGWIQVGSESGQRDVDLLVVAFPLVGLTASVGVITLAARAVMSRAHRTGTRLPTALFLAWRRITASETSAILLSAAMGIALGLMVFSTALVSSLEVASEAKANTIVGGETSLRMITRDEFALPAQSTIIHRETTRLTIGDNNVRVLVLDPATYETAISWDPLFGSSPGDVLAALESSTDADLAAIAVGQLPVPTTGGFGTSTVLSYEIVAKLDSMPLASPTFPTLVVRADHMESAGMRLHQLTRPPDLDAATWESFYRSPTSRFARILVSQLDADSVTQVLDRQGLDYRDVVTATSQRDLVGSRAAQWTFEYLWLLAIIAGLAGAGTLLFYLSERRTAVRLSEAMMLRMGLRSGTARAAAVIEMLGLMVLALVAGTTSALLLADRTFARFEPDPRIPPDVGLQYSIPVLAVIAGGAVVVIVAAALWSQRSTSQVSYSEVLRGS